MTSFKEKFPIQKRTDEAKHIMKKYPDRIPVIVEKEKSGDKLLEDIDKNKYLVPSNLTLGQFIYIIRQRIKLAPEKALFVFINNIIPPTSALMSSIYKQYHDSDFFLYFLYSGESIYGMTLYRKN